jgi:putative heme-binding domain-containing protein
MYREVIEHPWSIPENMKKLIDLNAGNDRGRIYRVVGEKFLQPQLPKLSNLSDEEMVRLLSHPNGWHRDTASRLIFERQHKNTIELVRRVLRSGADYAPLHALYLLNSFKALNADDLLTTIGSNNADIRENAVRFLASSNSVPLQKLVDDASARVRYQFAWALASINVPEKPAFFRKLLANAADVWENHAIHAAISRDPSLRAEFPQAFSHKPAADVAQTSSLRSLPITNAPRAEVVAKFTSALQLEGEAAKGRTIYLERCASCHRLFGQGTPVGPDLESVRTAGRETTLINIVDPNREVQPRFATYEVTTKDDEQIAGILANDAPNGLSLRQASGAEVFVPRAQIKSGRTAGTSLMPEGLEAGLTPQDMADLLAYIGGQ